VSNPKFWYAVALICGLATSLRAQNAAIARQPEASQSVAFTVGNSASSSATTFTANESSAFAEPEGGSVANAAYNNKYFALSYPLPAGWAEGPQGPPPSETGYYVLRSLKPGETFRGRSKGAILIAAWDLFFVPRPAVNVMELVKDMQGDLSRVYTVEAPPAAVRIAGHSFARLDYTAAAAQLHWRVLATEIRCHMVEFVFTSADTALLESLIQEMSQMKLPGEADAMSGTGGGEFPLCVKGYATEGNVLHKVDPVMVGPRFTTVPARVIIGADGKVKHIHVISSFPEQAKSVRDALAQWVFKPYTQHGAPAEVETGILFKFPPDGMKLPPAPEKY
jgi:Gram-negative bacterial TonB protein C-terminal